MGLTETGLANAVCTGSSALANEYNWHKDSGELRVTNAADCVGSSFSVCTQLNGLCALTDNVNHADLSTPLDSAVERIPVNSLDKIAGEGAGMAAPLA